MNKLPLCAFLVLMFFFKPSIAQNLPHPLDFKGSEREKKNIISFIEKNVYEFYCVENNMCTNSTLRMMERDELKSFKRLTKAKEEAILNNVIHTYCYQLNMCTYSTILMMYVEEVKASGKKLTW